MRRSDESGMKGGRVPKSGFLPFSGLASCYSFDLTTKAGRHGLGVVPEYEKGQYQNCAPVHQGRAHSTLPQTRIVAC